MPDDLTIIVDDVPRRVPADASLAAALFRLGVTSFRRDLGGDPRAPLCGMGTCFECRVVVDGIREVRSCLTAVREGMRVETGK